MITDSDTNYLIFIKFASILPILCSKLGLGTTKGGAGLPKLSKLTKNFLMTPRGPTWTTTGAAGGNSINANLETTVTAIRATPKLTSTGIAGVTNFLILFVFVCSLPL